VVLTDLGGMNVITPIAAPFLSKSGRSRPVPLSPTSFLLSSNGPGGAEKTADDVVYLFTGVGTLNQRTDITVPFLFTLAPGRAVRVNATRALVSSCGLDGVETSVDDRLVLLDGLGTTNSVTFIPTGSLSNYGAGRATVLSDEVAVLSTPGVDNVDITSDDGYVVVRNLSTTRDVQTTLVGGLDEDNGTHAVRLSPTLCAFVTAGPNFKFGFGTAADGLDDQVALLKVDETGMVTINRITVPGVDAATGSEVVVLSETSFLLGNGGADGKFNAGLDDTLTLVTSADAAAPTVQTITLGSSLGSSRDASVPAFLGDGRVTFAVTGPDNTMSKGADDEVRIVSGIPAPRTLAVKKAAIGFSATKPQKGETLSVTSTLTLDEPALLAGSEITVSIGRASQTLPAGALVAKKGGKFAYADKKGVNGFIRSVAWNTKSGKFTIKGKGVGTGAQRTAAGYIPVAIDAGDLYLSALLAGTASRTGIKYHD
jgi:hypothetical protein